MPNILILGGGAREHAIANALTRSTKKPKIFCCAPNKNPGISAITSDYWVGDIINNIEKIVVQAKLWEIDFAIIGPEIFLEKGLADILWQQNIPVIGPKQHLAQLETSKAFTRDLLNKYHIPGSITYRTFHELAGVKDFLQQLGENNYVIKANGLMGGKGVKVAGDHLHSISEAYQFCEELILNKKSFVIEEKMVGEEFSLLCFCDGKTLVPMPIVQDHKRAYNNDKGPNTGGMGSYSDANHKLPFLTQRDLQCAQEINQAVINALTIECQDKYIGILYGSFMATKNGIFLIEYNARFGDPEAMNVLAILKTDFVDICQAMLTEKLDEQQIVFKNLATVCKYAVPIGYPDQPEKDFLINIDKVENRAQLYFSAVNEKNNQLFSTGSRTVACVGIADTIAAAEKIAEQEICCVEGNLFHREDIGTEKLVNRRIQHMQELRQCAN